MAAVYGTLSKFNPQTQSWEDYTEVMGHYFTANEIKEDKKKQAIFLASVGDKIYALIKSLCQPGSPGDKKFDELVALVQEHFTPKPSEIVQRYKFYTRTRQAGETVHQFVAALRNLSKHCNFGSTLNIMMRDRLVVGMDDEKIQRKLLQEPGLTFEKALEIAVAMETTNKNLKELKNPVGPGEEKVNKVFASKTKGQGSGKPDQRKYTSKKGPEGKRCFRCGANHDPNACKYKEETCFNCQKKGHIKTVCRSKKAPACNLIQDNDDDESDVLPMYSAYHIVNAKEPPVEVSVEINSKPLQFEVDTGCPVTLISEETLSNVYEGKVPQLKKSVLRLKSYTGQQLKTLGMVETEIQYQNHTRVVPLTVVEGNGPSLLGRDLIREFSVMKISQRNLTLQDVLSKHEEVFKKGLGTLKGAKAKIHVPEGATPRFFKPRSLPYAMKGKVESEIDRLVGEGILKPVEFSEWAAPIVPVLKPDNTIRLCGDYKVTVNQVSHLEQYPLPSLEDISAKLAGGKKFTKLDMSHAYQQLLLDEESSKYVTINTHRGLFTYSRLPYGVSSAPAIFQRTVESLLRDIPGVAVYMDDIILTGTNDVEHLETLDLVLTKLEESGLRLKQAKCTLLAEEVVYLGHKFDAQGIHPVKDKVQALLETRAPQNVTELKSYLGLLNYYNRFLPNLSTVLTPLHRLLRKATPWQWGEAEQKCFETTKKLITGAGVLVYYNSDQPLILQCDASPYGLGAVLSHRMEDTSDKPIAFASRTLNSAEKNYSQLDKEGASVMFGLKKFHKYLYGRHFTIVTDHKPLVSLFSEKKQVPVTASPRVQRWAVTLRGYEYDIVYKSGHSHGNADALSRLPLPVTTRVEAEESVLLLREVEDFPLTANQISNWTHRDPVLAHVKEYLLRGWPQSIDDPELIPYTSRKNELSVQDGCVLWGARVVVPPQGRKLVLAELHQAHPGICRMKSLARSYVWWPSLDKDLQALVQSCEVCQVNQKTPAAAPLHPWEWPDQPWRRIHIDYAGPFMGRMFLVVVDAHSKWIECHIMQSTTSASTICKLREIFGTHGLPETVVSDNGTNFTSSEFEDFMRQNGIIHKTSAPYHPASNGLAERAVQTVKDGLTKMPGSSVAQKLQLVLFNYRLTPHSTTGRSPAEMLMGRKLRSRLDLLHPNLQSKVHKKQERMKEIHDAHAMERQFKEGDKIYLKNFGHGPKWLSGVIQMVTGPVSYTVVTADGREHRRHVDHIRTRYEEQEVSVPEAPPNSDVATGISALASSSHSRQPEGGEIDTIPQPTEGDQPTPYNTDSTQASQDSNDPESTDVEAAEAVAEASAPMQIPTPEQLPRRSDRVRRAPVHLKDFVTGV